MQDSRKNQATKGRLTLRAGKLLRYSLFVALVCGISVLTAARAHAQYKASLRGTVTDPSGAVIPGAKVSLLDRSTNYVLSTTTNGSGVYTFNALPPDHFVMTIEQNGFEKKVLSNVVIVPEQANALNIQMAVGSLSQTVTVSGVTSALNTDTATISQTITSNEIQHMPSFDRNIFALAELAPGVFGDGGSYNVPGNQGPVTCPPKTAHF